jgi:hypothetical protein
MLKIIAIAAVVVVLHLGFITRRLATVSRRLRHSWPVGGDVLPFRRARAMGKIECRN